MEKKIWCSSAGVLVTGTCFNYSWAGRSMGVWSVTTCIQGSYNRGVYWSSSQSHLRTKLDDGVSPAPIPRHQNNSLFLFNPPNTPFLSALNHNQPVLCHQTNQQTINVLQINPSFSHTSHTSPIGFFFSHIFAVQDTDIQDTDCEIHPTYRNTFQVIKSKEWCCCMAVISTRALFNNILNNNNIFVIILPKLRIKPGNIVNIAMIVMCFLFVPLSKDCVIQLFLHSLHISIQVGMRVLRHFNAS